MSKKKEIYKDGDKFVFQNIIQRDFTADEPPPQDPNKALEYHLDNMCRPEPILEGLKREMERSKAIASKNLDSTMLEALEDFELDLEITIAACERSEFDFVAFKMFHLGRTLESLNFLPAIKAALANSKRGDKAQIATNSAHDECFTDLKEKALQVLEDHPEIRIGKLCDNLTKYYGYDTKTIRKRLDKLILNDPFLPESCFKKGRPNKVSNR